MKITVLSQYYQTSSEPGISLLADMVEDFVKRGNEVHVVAGRYAYMNRAYLPNTGENPLGYVVHRSWSGNEKNRSKLARIRSFLAFSAAALTGLFRTGRSDLVFASSPSIFPVLTGWMWARLTGATFIIEIRDLWPESAEALGIIRNRIPLGLTTWLANFLYRRSDGIVALTYGIAESLRAQCAPRAPILVARCAVAGPAPAVSPRERSEIRASLGWADKCVAVYLGNIGYANDVECVVEAAGQLRHRADLHIAVIGDGVMRGTIKATSRDLPNFELLEPVPKKVVASYLAAADIGLCPLRNLPLFNGAVPTKLLDYMAAGLPVVAAGLTEISEIVRAGGAGLLYQPGNAAELAAALRTLADDEANRHSAGESARQAIRGEFRLDQRHEALNSFINRLVNRRRRAGRDGASPSSGARS
jgi:glycosyltransferase involved in cell wall biosynthesis